MLLVVTADLWPVIRRQVFEPTLAELRQQNGRNDTSLEDMFIALVDAEAVAA